MLRKYDPDDALKLPKTPMRVKATALVPWEGSATERDTLDYIMFMGDLVWLTKTNPSLVYAALDLAQFLKCPGPDHVAAAH